jgi:arsenate reductase (thioredoxin)
MAQGFLQSFDKRLKVFSAGTEPAERVNPKAVDAMRKAGIDISKHTPKNVDQYLDEEWDYVITVCNNANEACPFFPGRVLHRLHMGFDDPSLLKGSYVDIMNGYYRIRDEIRDMFYKFYETELKKRI